MNFQKYMNSSLLAADPLRGTALTKDLLNLSTGLITRSIKSIAFQGNEDFKIYQASTSGIGASIIINDMKSNSRSNGLCSHFNAISSPSGAVSNGVCFGAASNLVYFVFSTQTAEDLNLSTIDSIKAWIQSQYNLGTPLTIWYPLDVSTTSSITVPSGLSGTVEGFLNQSGTPTPTASIYPTANDAKAWYDIASHIMDTTWTTGSTYERDSGVWT